MGEKSFVNEVSSEFCMLISTLQTAEHTHPSKHEGFEFIQSSALLLLLEREEERGEQRLKIGMNA